MEYTPDRIAFLERQAAKWSLLMRFMTRAETGDVETTNIGAESHVKMVANEDGSVTITEHEGTVRED